jgi:hypothetical protein
LDPAAGIWERCAATLSAVAAPAELHLPAAVEQTALFSYTFRFVLIWKTCERLLNG